MSKKRAVTRTEILEVVEQLCQGDPDYRKVYEALSNSQKEKVMSLVLYIANNFDGFGSFEDQYKRYIKEKSPSNSLAGVR